MLALHARALTLPASITRLTTSELLFEGDAFFTDFLHSYCNPPIQSTNQYISPPIRYGNPPIGGHGPSL